MARLRDAIKSLFQKLNDDDAKLFRVEFLVIFTAFVVLTMSYLDYCRNLSVDYYRSPVLRYLVLVLRAIAGSVVTYTVGVMQSTPFNNGLIQVWCVLLTMLYDGSSNFSAYSLQVVDVYARRRQVVNDLMNTLFVTLFVANHNATHDTKFIVLVWVLWGANTLKLLHRIFAMEFAAGSYALGLNSRLVADYMHNEHELITDYDPATMKGYRYLVLGEEHQKVDRDSTCHLELKVTRKDKLITLDKVWECPGTLLNPAPGASQKSKDRADKLKDLCLSFALYKLLRRRFDDEHLVIAEAKLEKTRNLVFRGLLRDGKDYNRAFRVIGTELAFMSDYLHSTHPLISSYGLPIFTPVLSGIILGASYWLVVLLIRRYQPPDHIVFHKILGKNAEVGITVAVLLVIIAKESCEISTYFNSIWETLAQIGEYVRSLPRRPSFFLHMHLWWHEMMRNQHYMGRGANARMGGPESPERGGGVAGGGPPRTSSFHYMYSMFYESVDFSFVWKYWHDSIHQYSLLGSYWYEPWCWFWRLMAINAKEGGKAARRIHLSDELKETVMNSLRSGLVDGHVELTNGLRSLQRNNVSHGLHWACRLETHTHTILVWHIATSLCEISLGQHNSLAPADSWETPAYDVDVGKLPVELKSNYMAATSLSRYCAYLLVFVPDLLPDGISFTSDCIFKDTVYQLRSYLHDCDHRSSLQAIYEKMMDIGEDDANDIVAKGARLGKQLIETTENEERCWKVLADFWAEMILFLAPSSNAKKHAPCLTTGGQFITLIWALLTHAGILEQPKAPPEPI